MSLLQVQHAKIYNILIRILAFAQYSLTDPVPLTRTPHPYPDEASAEECTDLKDCFFFVIARVNFMFL